MKLVLLLLAAVPSFALADTRDDLKKIDAGLSACAGEAKLCIAAAQKSADSLLGHLFHAQVAKLKQRPDDENLEYVKRLEASQRAWLAHRDADASLHGVTSMDGASQEIAIAARKLELTKDRALELDELFDE